MKQLYVHTLAFNSLNFVRNAISLFEKQKPDYPIAGKILVDPNYPITGSLTPAQHSEALREIATEYGWQYVRMEKNLGVSGNWNWVMAHLGLGDGDALYGNDPDSRAEIPKYLDAMMAVLNGDPNCYTVQLNQAGVYLMNLPRDEFSVNGVNVIAYRQTYAWPCGIFDCGWLKKIGGLRQMHDYYGHIEVATARAAAPFGCRWYVLRDFYDSHQTADDSLYTEYKLAAAQHQTKDDFSTWLKARA